MEKSDICKRWSEYIENLYDDPNRSDEQLLFDGILSGPEIFTSEVCQAIKTSNIRGAPGPDNVRVEMLMLLNETALKYLILLMNQVYERGRLIKEICQSVFIPLPNKGGTVQYDEIRTISLMSHLTKILLKIVSQRMKSKIMQEIDVCQNGFRAGCGTRNAIFLLKVLSQRSIQMQTDIYLCFVDYTKAFDRVVHNELMHFLDDLELDDKDLRLTQSLNYQQEAGIRNNDTVSKMVLIKRGGRQGCVLYSLFSEILMRTIKNFPGIGVGGVSVNNLRNADDTVLIAKNQEDLQALVKQLDCVSKKFGMHINIKKTEVMVLSKKQKPQFARFG